MNEPQPYIMQISSRTTCARETRRRVGAKTKRVGFDSSRPFVHFARSNLLLPADVEFPERSIRMVKLEEGESYKKLGVRAGEHRPHSDDADRRYPLRVITSQRLLIAATYRKNNVQAVSRPGEGS